MFMLFEHFSKNNFLARSGKMEKIRQKIAIKEREIKEKYNIIGNITESALVEFGLRMVKLRPYQLEGVQWLIGRHEVGIGCILADEMGLGKTCQTISYLVCLYGRDNKIKKPSLIIAPLSVVENWKDELTRFAPDLPFLCYSGNADERHTLQQEISGRKDLRIVITTYEICLKDESFFQNKKWFNLIIDEAHRIKNQQSLLHQSLLQCTFDQRVLLTGTPIQNNLVELYSLLSFVAPDIFRPKHVEDFVSTYGDIASEGQTDISTILNPFLLRRVKSQVVKDLPKKTEVILYHGLSSVQKNYYRAILAKDIDAFNSEFNVNRTRLVNILMQLRKCVCHPYLFDGVEPEPFQIGEHLVEASGKLVVLDQLLAHLKENKHKVLIFSQMTRHLDIVQDYMTYRRYSYERLDGSVRAEERYLAIQNFNKHNDTFAFLLSTKAGGQGLNLTAADTVIFLDSDFNPQNDLQAAARAHRIGQQRNVKVIRLVGRNTVEEIILRRADKKLQLTNAVMTAGPSTSKDDANDNDNLKLEDIIKFGLDKLFENENSQIEDIDFTSVLGQTVDGKWQSEQLDVDNDDVQEPKAMDTDEATSVTKTSDNMYVFEGKDYSTNDDVINGPSNADLQAFQLLLDEEKAKESESLDNKGRSMRSKQNTLPSKLMLLPEENKTQKPRRKLTAEELEERRKKRVERMERLAKLEEEEEVRRAQEKKQRRMERWAANSYTSCNVEFSSDEESDEMEEDESGDEDEEDGKTARIIHYVVGDVTHPQNTSTEDAIIVHCVDNSGSWGQGGLFTHIDNRSMQPSEQYEMAGKMKDLALGDVHVIPVDDVQSRDSGNDLMALIVAQSRDRHNNLSGIKLAALRVAFRKLYRLAKSKKASIHLPRIGHRTPDFNWYGTERLIQKYFASHRIPTYVYYFPRKHNQKRRNEESKNKEALEENKGKRTRRDEPSVSSSSSSSTLPSFMNGISVLFVDRYDDVVKKMTRYLVAYDGNVHDSLQSDTTHVIVGDDQPTEALHGTSQESNLPLVRMRWLTDCFLKQKLIDFRKYQC